MRWPWSREKPEEPTVEVRRVFLRMHDGDLTVVRAHRTDSGWAARWIANDDQWSILLPGGAVEGTRLVKGWKPHSGWGQPDEGPREPDDREIAEDIERSFVEDRVDALEEALEATVAHNEATISSNTVLRETVFDLLGKVSRLVEMNVILVDKASEAEATISSLTELVRGLDSALSAFRYEHIVSLAGAGESIGDAQQDGSERALRLLREFVDREVRRVPK